MKISAYSIILLGLAIGIVVLSYGYFQHWVPNTTAAKYSRDHAADLETEIGKTKKAEQNFELAKKMREEQAAAWQVFVAQNTPSMSLASGGIDLSVDPWQLAIDARKFRDNVQHQLNVQMKRGGVKVISGPEIPAPEANSTSLLATYFNLGQFTYPIVIWDGTVHVQGTYKQICDNVRSWANIKGFLAVADGLAIQGTTMPLDATYNVTIVGYLKGRNFFGGVDEGGAVGASANIPTASTGGTGAPGGPRAPIGAPTGTSRLPGGMPPTVRAPGGPAGYNGGDPRVSGGPTGMPAGGK